MWKWLHPYAKPETQYRICGKLSPLFAFLTLILLGVGIVWGLAFAPADYQQGNSFRIMYVHVPTAIWSMGVYGSMAIAAVVALVWQIKASSSRNDCNGANWCIVYFLIACYGGQFGGNQCGYLVGVGCSLNCRIDFILSLSWYLSPLFCFFQIVT